MAGGLLVELLQRYPLHPRVKSQNARAWGVAVANPLGVIGDLAGVHPAVVGVIASKIVYLWLPLHPSRGGKIGDSEFVPPNFELTSGTFSR